MCISRWLLEPCAHGAGLIVAALSAGEHLAMRPASPPMVVAMPRRLWLAENRALTSSFSWSSWRLSWSPWRSSLPSSLSLPFLPRGLVGLTNARTLRTSTRAIKLTRKQQILYHVGLTRGLQRRGLAMMSNADVPPTRGLRDISNSPAAMTLHDSSTATGRSTVVLAFARAQTPGLPATGSHRPCRRYPCARFTSAPITIHRMTMRKSGCVSAALVAVRHMPMARPWILLHPWLTPLATRAVLWPRGRNHGLSSISLKGTISCL
jgi:hypothetical protein